MLEYEQRSSNEDPNDDDDETTTRLIKRDDSIAKWKSVLSSLCLSLSLSFKLCFQQNSSSSFFMKFLYKIWDHFWKKKRRREKKGKSLAKTLTIRRYVQNGALSVQKFLAKEYHKPTLTEFLKQPTETLLSSRIQKKQKPLLTRKKKNGASPGGKSLLVL